MRTRFQIDRNAIGKITINQMAIPTIPKKPANKNSGSGTRNRTVTAIRPNGPIVVELARHRE